MDSRNNFLKNLENFINCLDDEYLISATNKGIVNRSKKDLEKIESIEYEVKEDKIDFKINDIECSITCDIHDYKCSCPSRSICKHIVMCYLYVMENKGLFFKDCEKGMDEPSYETQNGTGKSEYEYGTQNSETVNETRELKSEDTNLEDTLKNETNKKEFKTIKELSIEAIKKLIGEKDLINIIKRIEFGVNYNIQEGIIISVDFIDENIKVKLLDDLKNSVCSCKSKEMCVHKAEAIILYKIHKGYLEFEELKKYDSSVNSIDKESTIKACREIQSVLGEILVNGLSRLPQSILEKISNCAVLCHNYDMPNFEKNLRDIREEVNLYFKKNASFTLINLQNKITRLYMNTERLLNSDDMKKYAGIIGEFKSSYYEVPPFELYGIGSENWKTKSGYEGTTYYFYENNKSKIFTFTKSAPVFYDNANTSSKSFVNNNSTVPWNLNCEISDLGFSHFKLVNGKVNYKRRISSSSKSKGVLIDRTKISSLSLEGIRVDKFEDLIHLFENRTEDENYNLVFIKGKSFGESSFDDIKQIFSAEIYDEYNKRIKINILFSPKTKRMIRILEKMVKGFSVPLFFGRVYLKDGEIMFYPITYYVDEYGTDLT